MSWGVIRDRVRAHLFESAEVKRQTARSHADIIAIAAQCVTGTFQRGGKLMLCGNGGSAADSQHIAAEFTNRFRPDLGRPALPALALTTDTSFLTSHGNDFSFETVYTRQIEAFGRAGDVLIAISTSGNSANVVHAVLTCRNLSIQTIGLLGGDGGLLGKLVDVPVIVPSGSTQHVQETHIAIGHIIADLVEADLFDQDGVDFSMAPPMVSTVSLNGDDAAHLTPPDGPTNGAAVRRTPSHEVKV